MKLLRVTGNTLVGYDLRVGVFGNCFSVMCDDGKERFVANIGMESLQATGIAFPIEATIATKENLIVYITDSRIPLEAYRTHCCGMHHDKEAFDEWKANSIR